MQRLLQTNTPRDAQNSIIWPIFIHIQSLIEIDQKMKICPLEVGWTGWHVRAKGHNRQGMPDYGQACWHPQQKQTKTLVDLNDKCTI